MNIGEGRTEIGKTVIGRTVIDDDNLPAGFFQGLPDGIKTLFEKVFYIIIHYDNRQLQAGAYLMPRSTKFFTGVQNSLYHCHNFISR
jgi:hypothetical protein